LKILIGSDFVNNFYNWWQ